MESAGSGSGDQQKSAAEHHEGEVEAHRIEAHRIEAYRTETHIARAHPAVAALVEVCTLPEMDEAQKLEIEVNAPEVKRPSVEMQQSRVEPRELATHPLIQEPDWPLGLVSVPDRLQRETWQQRVSRARSWNDPWTAPTVETLESPSYADRQAPEPQRLRPQ